MHSKRLLVGIMFAGLLAALGGCNNGSVGSSGTMSLGVTDTPVDGAQTVQVAFTGVTLQGPNGQKTITFSKEKTINLLNLQGNASTSLFSGETVPAGQYQWIRLNLDLANSYIITSSGNQYPLTIPSGSQTGLKLVQGFTVAQGSQADFTIDFDLRKSLTMTSNSSTGAVTYILKPALRLINNQQIGTISGTVSSTFTVGSTALSTTGCYPAVYVYQSTGITPEGFDVTVTGGTAPLTSATLNLDNSTGKYNYTVGFLAPGSYTLAVTCSGYDYSGSTKFQLSPVQTTTVSANQTSTVNFAQP